MEGMLWLPVMPLMSVDWLPGSLNVFNPYSALYAVTWDGRNFTWLHPLPDADPYEGGKARGMNDLGDVVGVAETDGSFFVDDRVCLWIDGQPMNPGSLYGGRSEAWGINNFRQIVGTADSERRSYLPRAFLWENGVMVEMPNPTGGPLSAALDINDSGGAVGYVRDAQLAYHAASWRDGLCTVLPSLSEGGDCKAWDINELGEIVGYANDEGCCGWNHAVLWRDGVIQEIHNPRPIYLGQLWQTYAYAINNLGQSVGFSEDDGGYDIYAWTTVGDEQVPLFALIAPRSRWTPEVA